MVDSLLSLLVFLGGPGRATVVLVPRDVPRFGVGVMKCPCSLARAIKLPSLCSHLQIGRFPVATTVMSVDE